MRGIDLLPALTMVAGCVGDPQDQEALRLAGEFGQRIQECKVLVVTEPALQGGTGEGSSIATFNIAAPANVKQQTCIADGVAPVLGTSPCNGVGVSYPGRDQITPVGTDEQFTVKVVVPPTACERY